MVLAKETKMTDAVPCGDTVADMLRALAPIHDLREVKLELRQREDDGLKFSIWAVKYPDADTRVYLGFVSRDYLSDAEFIKDMDDARPVWRELTTGGWKPCPVHSKDTSELRPVPCPLCKERR
jgi:hypothetical protein